MQSTIPENARTSFRQRTPFNTPGNVTLTCTRLCPVAAAAGTAGGANARLLTYLKSGKRLIRLTRDEMQNCQWLKPLLVAQISFQEWTPDGHLRHPSFAGLRNDKEPSRVLRE
jgi:ATP dependent DNA ligase C terminal region